MGGVSKTGRARRIAAAAAYGGGGVGLLGLTGFGLLVGEARLARRRIGKPFGPDGLATDGVYGGGPGEPLELAVLGDSSSTFRRDDLARSGTRSIQVEHGDLAGTDVAAGISSRTPGTDSASS